MLRVGLTGGIACGKSHVLRRLAARGLHTLDLDAVARAVTAPGSSALAEIATAFGAGMVGPGGSLDRAALGGLVFGSAEARARLNAIVHPRVRAAEAAWAASLAGREGGILVTDAALLVETGAHLRFDRLVVVHCDPGQQIARLRARDGLDERAARARIEAQMPIVEKRAFAHLEVDASGSVADTDRAADALATTLDALAREAGTPKGAGVEALLGGLVHGPGAGPRGLAPEDVLAAAAEAGGLEMEGLARRLAPPSAGPWYRAAGEADPGPPAACLAVAVAAWALRRGGTDPPSLAAAAGSVARLTHVEAQARADASLLALVAREVVLAGGTTAGIDVWTRELTPLATRFGGGAPSGRLFPVWAAARLHPLDPERARAECRRRGGEAALASALAGLGAPVEPTPDAARLRSVLEGVKPAER